LFVGELSWSADLKSCNLTRNDTKSIAKNSIDPHVQQKVHETEQNGESNKPE